MCHRHGFARGPIVYYRERLSLIRYGGGMAGIAVVAAGTGDGAPVDVTVLAGSVRALTEAGWSPVVVTPAAAPASSIGAPRCLGGAAGAPGPPDAGSLRAVRRVVRGT